MKNLLYYLLQMIIASGILYGYYHLVLRNKRFHIYNRFYLLAAVLISLLIPFVNIPVYFTAEETHSSFVLQTLTVISSPGFDETSVVPIITESVKESWFTWQNLSYSLYILIAFVALLRILFSLLKIRSIIRNNPVEKLQTIRFVNTDEPGTPFSFFRWLFWNRKIELKSAKGEQVFRHELFHIQQKHSRDILFMELLTTVFWINPFFHLLKKELKAIHEFLADEFAIKETEKWQYAELLLMQAMNTQIHLTNPFFHNQIKRRIAMITSSSKPSYQYLRKLLVLPVAAIVVALFAFKYKSKLNDPIIRAEKPITVVIDAGHGGTDQGARSLYANYSEAQITLEIAKMIQKLSGEYNVNIAMTRENENFPGGAKNRDEGLRQRLNLANKISPDAYISIHMNTADRNVTQNNYSGIETYITNKKETGNDQLLASTVLQELSTIYKTDLEIKQRMSQGIYVLDHNVYPSILIECGYIDNPEDLAFISDKMNQEKIARAILKGIVKFTNITDTTKPEQVALKKSAPADAYKPNVEVHLKEDIYLYADTMFFNGVSAVNAKIISKDSSNPLIVLNGKVMEGVKLKNLDGVIKPEAIQSITILKGISAAAKYGSNVKDGVIEIITKKNIQNLDLKEISVGDTAKPQTVVFEKVEVEASFPGGEQAWKRYLEKVLDQNIGTKNGAPKGVYTVYIQFVVDIDGNISNVIPLTKHGYGMEKEAIRVISKGPKWVPAVQNGKNVKAYRKVPINFYVNPDGKSASDLSMNLSEIRIKDTTPSNVKQYENALIIFNGVEQTGLTLSQVTKKMDVGNIESIRIKFMKPNEAIIKYGNKGNKGAVELDTKENKDIRIKEVTPSDMNVNDNKVFEKVETEPSFPGGKEAWRAYLQKSTSDFNPADNGAPEGTDTVIVQFIVHTDGSISNIKPLTNCGYKMEEKVVELISKGPKWVPAIQNENKVTAYKKQTVYFQISEDTEPDTQKSISTENNKTNTQSTKDIKKEIQNGYIYPNPSTNLVNIPLSSQSNGQGSVNVFDLSGNLVLNLKPDLIKGLNTIAVDTKKIRPGSYIIKINCSDKSERTYKMIKE